MLINERKTHIHFCGLKVKKGIQAGVDILIILIIILNNQSAEILRKKSSLERNIFLFIILFLADFLKYQQYL